MNPWAHQTTIVPLLQFDGFRSSWSDFELVAAWWYDSKSDHDDLSGVPALLTTFINSIPTTTVVEVVSFRL